jgi:uncharacterized protein YodC (DUF2158 family)
MERDFTVGDVVKLNSNKTKMTVEAVLDNKVKCIWFDGKNHLNRNEFSKSIVTHVKKKRGEQ